MRKLTTRLAIALFTFVLSTTASLSYLASCGSVRQKKDPASVIQEKQELHLIVPQASWEPIFFKGIDERTKKANLPSLRATLLSNDDLEIRIWFVVSYYGLDGIVLRRSADQWSGIYLSGVSKDPHLRNEYQRPLAVPRSGWKTTWESLVSAGLLTLPDGSEVQCTSLGHDGVGYIVETNTNKTYRTYMYGNPQFAKCDGAKQMIKLVEIIDHEFGLEWPTTG